jgi:predicted metal-dependent hydrolase
MLKLFGNKDIKTTFNVDLYNEFLKGLHLSVPKDKNDPVLEESFNRVNEKYFNSLIDRPNLVWGGKTKRQLGCYDFHTDTIKISLMLAGEELLLDYVMYHELLHKKLKFKATARRNLFHSKAFRDAEKRFMGYEEAERRLKVLRWNKAKKGFFERILGENFI